MLAAAGERQGLERMDQIKYALLERSGSVSIIQRRAACDRASDPQHIVTASHANAGAFAPAAVLPLHPCHAAHGVQELTLGALALSFAATTIGAGGIGRTPLTLAVLGAALALAVVLVLGALWTVLTMGSVWRFEHS